MKPTCYFSSKQKDKKKVVKTLFEDTQKYLGDSINVMQLYDKRMRIRDAQEVLFDYINWVDLDGRYRNKVLKEGHS